MEAGCACAEAFPGCASQRSPLPIMVGSSLDHGWLKPGSQVWNEARDAHFARVALGPLPSLFSSKAAPGEPHTASANPIPESLSSVLELLV